WDALGSVRCCLEAHAFEEAEQGFAILESLKLSSWDRTEATELREMLIREEVRFGSDFYEEFQKLALEKPSDIRTTSLLFPLQDWISPIPFRISAYFLARMAGESGHFEVARQLYEGLSTAYPDHLNYRLLAVDADLRIGHFRSANARLEASDSSDFRIP